jgi:trehalose-phosphatase
VGLENVVYGGCHGLEIAGAGVRFRHPKARAGAARVKAATRILARELRRFPGAFLELKGQAVSVHYRKVPQRRRGELLNFGAQVKREVPGLVSLSGKNVLEFLPQVNWGKGQAALWIARRLVPTLRPRCAVILYAGDDATDEAAFAALKGRGVTVRVGGRRGLADYAVKNISGTHALLRWLLRAIG